MVVEEDPLGFRIQDSLAPLNGTIVVVGMHGRGLLMLEMRLSSLVYDDATLEPLEADCIP